MFSIRTLTKKAGPGVISDFDVAIAGGGPAGSAAAIWAARKGLKVALLEAGRSPCDRPGESLHPGMGALFEQLGVSERILRAGFVRYPGHLVCFAGKVTLHEFGGDANGPWLGFQIPRRELDSILLQQALHEGVTVLQPCRALWPVLHSGRVVGVQSSLGTITARFVMDASGSRHWLQRKTGMALTAVSPPLFAAYGYSRATDPVGLLPVMLAGPNGWTWIARIDSEQLSWTRLSLGRYNGAVPECLAGFTPLSRTRGADVTWRRVEPCAGSGYFMVGDSACVVDPACSHGVMRAVMSGMMAAHLAADALAGRVSEDEAAANFRAWTRRWFIHDTSTLRRLYAGLRFESRKPSSRRAG
jgi:flavin-dependent dehydrogenase